MYEPFLFRPPPTRRTDMASTSHIERTADEPRHSELHEGVIVSIQNVNERIRLFRLELPSGPVKVHHLAIATPGHATRY